MHNDQNEDEAKRRHDIQKALRSLNNAITLMKRGYDFTTERGSVVVAELEHAKAFFEKEFDINSSDQ